MATTIASCHILGRAALVATNVKNRASQDLLLELRFFTNSGRIPSAPVAFPFLTFIKVICTYFSIKSSIKVYLSSQFSSSLLYSFAIVMFFYLVSLMFEVLKRLFATAFGETLFSFRICWKALSFQKGPSFSGLSGRSPSLPQF